MIFTPTHMPFADHYTGKGWRSKLAKKAAKLAYRDMLWTRNLREIIAANAFVAKCDAERKAREL